MFSFPTKSPRHGATEQADSTQRALLLTASGKDSGMRNGQWQRGEILPYQLAPSEHPAFFC